jgi:hypothetical protein
LGGCGNGWLAANGGSPQGTARARSIYSIPNAKFRMPNLKWPTARIGNPSWHSSSLHPYQDGESLNSGARRGLASFAFMI